MFAEFDQQIDPAAVAGKISVSCGSRCLSVRVASAQELEQAGNNAPAVRAAILRATTGRWVAFVLNDGSSLDYDARITVSLARGLVCEAFSQ